MLKPDEIGRRISGLRKIKGLTIDELAQAIGVSKSTISRYETGQFERVKMPVLFSISQVLGVPPEYLSIQEDDCELDFALSLYQPEVSPDAEQTLISLYRSLNEEGREKLLDYADDLAQSGKYIKTPAAGVSEA